MSVSEEELRAAIVQIASHADVETLSELRRLFGTTVASGERSVAVSGDARGAIITTGDSHTTINIAFQDDGIGIDGQTYCGEGAEHLRSLLGEILAPQLKIDWPQVSRELLEEHFQLTTNPLTSREDISYEFGQVYIPLGLVARKKVPRIQEDVTAERGSELYQADIHQANTEQGQHRKGIETVEIVQRFENDEFIEQVLRQRQSPKSQGTRLAIIGEPGAGKTTLLQQTARWLSTQYPDDIIIWISLADLQDDTLESYLEKHWLQRIVREAGSADVLFIHKQDFTNQMQQKQVWLILDGLDEMQSIDNILNSIQRQIQQGGWLQRTRIIATCRLNLWDSSSNTLTEFDVFRTLDFDYPQAVESFITQWFEPRDKKELGEILCTALSASGKERIRDLVKNPLRLTLLCFSWYLKQGQLPDTQSDLYHRFIERVYDWKQTAFSTTTAQRIHLNQALSTLSIQALESTGSSRFRLSQALVHRCLSQTLPNSNKTVLDLALDIGWLNKVGVDANDPELPVYAFYHTTFEEYFASIGIDNASFFLNPVPHDPLAPEASYRVLEARWEQVFLLWLGRQDNSLSSEKNALVRSLLTFKDKCGGFYSDRAFLIAVVGLVEFPACTAAETIIAQLLDWQFGRPNWLWQAWLEFVDPIRTDTRRHAAEKALFQTNRKQAIYALTANLNPSFKNTRFQRFLWMLRHCVDEKQKLDRYQAIASKLGELDPDNPAAITTLNRIVAITWDKYPKTCSNAAPSLGKVGQNQETAVRTFIDIITLQQKLVTLSIKQEQATLKSIFYGFFTDSMMIEAYRRVMPVYDDLRLYRQNSRSSSLSKTFFKQLSKYSTNNVVFRWFNWRVIRFRSFHTFSLAGIAHGLGDTNVCREAANQALVHLLSMWPIHQNLDYGVRWEVINSLSKIGNNNSHAIHGLLWVLTTPNPLDIHLLAVEGLGRIAPGNEAAIQLLSNILENNPDEELRWVASESLERIGTGNAAAVAYLSQIIGKATDDDILCVAAKSLSIIDPGNSTAAQTLESLLKTTKDSFIRGISTGLLQTRDPASQRENIIKALIKSVEETENATPHSKSRYRRAAHLLSNKAYIHRELAVSNLIETIHTNQNSLIKENAIISLGNVGRNNDAASHALLQVLNTECLYWIREKAAENLAIVGLGPESLTRQSFKTLRRHRFNRKFHKLLWEYIERERYQDVHKFFETYPLPSLLIKGFAADLAAIFRDIFWQWPKEKPPRY